VIVRVLAPRGGNLIEVETADGSRSLCRLPNRYRKVVWVKRGTLLIVDSCSEVYSTAAGEEGKVKFVVNHVIFTDDQIKNLRSTGKLPAAFDAKAGDELEKQSDDLLQDNKNRRPNLGLSDSSENESSDEDSSKEENGVVDDAEEAESGSDGVASG